MEQATEMVKNFTPEMSEVEVSDGEIYQAVSRKDMTPEEIATLEKLMEEMAGKPPVVTH